MVNTSVEWFARCTGEVLVLSDDGKYCEVLD